jgi:predicted amidophosphoribosyltransferase
MTASSEAASCAECAAPIVGDHPRCPACQEQSRRRESVGHSLVAWIVFAELLGAFVCGILLVAKGCSL